MRNPYRLLALALAAFAMLLGVTSTARQAPPKPPAVAAEAVRPALWKVADADTTIWLFGTIHALPPGVPWYEGRVKAAFEGAQELVTEVVESGDAEIQQSVLRTARLPEGQQLRELLSADQRARYEAALASLRLPATAFDAYKPWYAAIGLATIPLVQQGYSTQGGVEFTLTRRAGELRQTHTALETVQYQIGLFDSLPLPVQSRYLVEVSDSLPRLRTELDQIVAAWKRGDAERLASLMNAAEDDPAMVETLIVNRNRAWAGWIRHRLERPGTVFLAVGAGHLAGAGSLHDQLAAIGIVSTRVQ